MSGVLIKPGDRSVLGIREDWPVNGWVATHVHHASLNIDLGDFLIMGIIGTRGVNHTTDIVFKDGGVTGYTLRVITNGIRLILHNNVGAIVFIDVLCTIPRGRNLIVVFGDRDGDMYVYINGTFAGSASMAGTNIDQSNAALFYMLYNSRTYSAYRHDGLLAYQQYMFGIGGIPSAADRANISAQYQASPWNIPPILSARPNYATEKCLHLNFDNLDPAWDYIPDVSAYANNMSLSGGALVLTAVKEFMAP